MSALGLHLKKKVAGVDSVPNVKLSAIQAVCTALAAGLGSVANKPVGTEHS